MSANKLILAALITAASAGTALADEPCHQEYQQDAYQPGTQQSGQWAWDATSGQWIYREAPMVVEVPQAPIYEYGQVPVESQAQPAGQWVWNAASAQWTWVASAPVASPGAAQRLARYDLDHDGRLSWAERLRLKQDRQRARGWRR